MPVFRGILLVTLVLTAAVFPVIHPAQAQETPVITIGTTDLPGTLDPGEAYDFAAWEVLNHLYTGLTRQIPGTLDYELTLAAGYEVSDDSLTYTFTLRDDAVFDGGTPITAQTFVDSITRVQTLKRDAAKAVTPFIAQVEAGDDGELVFHLTRPVPYFLGLLSLPPYFPQHPTLVQNDQPLPFPDQIIGNGPYVLDRYDVRQEIVLKANPAYKFGPQPATPVITLRQFENSQSLSQALQAHEVDIAWRALFLPDLLELEKVAALNVIDSPGTRVFYLYMNHDLEPFDDPLVREAVTLLINRQDIVDNVFDGHATALTSMVPALFAGAYAPIWPDTPDQPRAEEVLRTAAYTTRGQGRLNFTITTSQPTYGDIYVSAAVELNRGSFVPSDFISSGVFADVDTTTFIRALERGEGRLTLFAWTPLVPHPEAYLRPLVYSAEPIPSRGEYAKAETDALLDQAALADNTGEQNAAYQQVSEWLLLDYDIIPVWQDHFQLAALNTIEGIQIEPNSFLHYDQLVRR